MQVSSAVLGNCLCRSCEAEKEGRQGDGETRDANVCSIECDEIVVECGSENGCPIPEMQERTSP